MQGFVILSSVFAASALWHVWLYKSSGGRTWSPLWGAFTFTTVSILFIVAGAVGYKMTHGVPFANPEEWTGQVIWPQIGVGVVTAIIAAFLWRIGLRTLADTPPPHQRQRSA